jgi:chorismate synthase
MRKILPIRSAANFIETHKFYADESKNPQPSSARATVRTVITGQFKKSGSTFGQIQVGWWLSAWQNSFGHRPHHPAA